MIILSAAYPPPYQHSYPESYKQSYPHEQQIKHRFISGVKRIVLRYE
ncbi:MULTISPECIES: hypothetical protein [Acinetobacter]|uniref:Uncharacterized protein n=2 Tax=Acinetobacter TaxID=469 RepID=A0AA46NCH6_9GAMM|nr:MULTISPECIES: hypothetical protein [Acinetobacter]MCH2016741.1 hypothetical protein [Acinetobacter ursingii]MCU4350746.1 hypothetical protein [Acinetobacter ursingii]MCU4481082.1 hypothetical protein [Acinetobacter ursingii]MCU4505411.1 hypothetical protein [Acinetobacter ursingii]QXZ24349.1 hypothetical protein I6L31_06285 [Acinetobacter septicus]